MKFSKRFIFVPLLLAIFAYLFYSAYSNIKARTLNEFNNQQLTLAKEASKGIESFFDYYRRELLFLSEIEDISELNSRGAELIADFYRHHSDQIEAISIVDEKGILKYTFPEIKSAIGRDISDQEHIREIIRIHKPTVSDVFTSVQGFMTIAYHIPIIRGNEFKGSIAILIPMNKLGQHFIENIRAAETGYGWMISKESMILYNPKYNQSGKNARELYKNYPSVLELIDRTLKESEGTSFCITGSPDRVNNEEIATIVSFYRISLDNTFWTIISFTPEKEVFAKLTSFRNSLIILFLLIIVIFSLYFYFTLKASLILKADKKRTALERVLRESEKRFRIIFELSPAGIILTDEDGTIIEVNSSFCKALGYSREELLSKNLRIFSSPEGFGNIEENISYILSGKRLRHETTYIRKDGTPFRLELDATLITLPDGKPGILSVSNDITEREKVYQELIDAKEKAEESDRLKSAFLTNMSHELRTPLNAIIGFSDLMISGGYDKETLSYLKIIADSGHHLLGLVEEILDISMIETKQVKINYEKVQVNSILYDVRNIISGEILNEKKSGIELILNADPERYDFFIFTDGRKLKQVLLNLLKNSLKFTEEGQIEFGYTQKVKEGADFLQFYVKDTGIGIDKKYHDVIFNIFRQIDDTHTRKYGGTGIGLSIASRIIGLLGGDIWVESELGQGSVFYFTVPLVSEMADSASLSPETNIDTEKDYSGKTILIAEDEATNFEFLKIIFEKMNIRVLWAKNGLEAFDICESDSSVSLVLMDIKMPFLNGLDSRRRIKKIRPGLPVVAQTAFALLTDREDAIKAGCDDYISKPIDIEQLKKLINKYL